MKRTIYAFVGLLFSMSAFSANLSLPPQTISSIETGNFDEGVYLKLHGFITAPGCNTVMLLIPKKNPMYNEIVAMSLSAFHAKTKVTIRVTNCQTANEDYLNVVSIFLSE